MVDLVHQLSGKHIVYVLQCEPLDGKETRYVGTSTSIEKRTCEHLGLAKSKGASWCAKHKPVSVLEVRVCNTKEEAACMEVMLTSIHQAQVGYQHCRGGRWNMPGDMRKKPPHFDNAEEYYTSPRSTATEKSEEPEMTHDQWVNGVTHVDGKLAMLPPMYHVLAPKDEEGRITEPPPRECLKFQNPKDPDGRLGILAGLVLH